MLDEIESKLGKPLWVESLMSIEEYKEAHKLYPNTVLTNKPEEYDPTHYKGGRWRYRMGKGYTEEEIKIICKRMEEILNETYKIL